MIFCSTIIPTVGRSSLSKAVESVLNQELSQAAYEIIVVNDSGLPLEKAAWQSDMRVQVIETICRERSVARNTGAAVAKGAYLHFLDDDDWLAPGAYEHLWALSQSSQAQWLYGISQLVNRDHTPIIRLQHHLKGNCFVRFMAGEWIPLQSSMIDARTFFKVGGFVPSLSGPEDIDLLRRISLAGEIAETPQLIAYIVRDEKGSTTNYRSHREDSRSAREKILDAPRAFNTMLASATTPAWHGYATRIYLTSMIWNIRRKRPLTAASRAVHGFAAIFMAGLGVFTKAFWGSVI
jgi:glycosyltransferase involved in cell wall biosynthesis